MRVVESGFSSATRTTVTDATFPAGLRVLVVDDDLTWLKILEKMLEKCSYEVTTCCMARDALKMLRERKDDFDIIISDVNMPDMDGFKLLEFVGLEMDLPVIMMSVDGETNRVMKGVQHGACDYLLKPIQMKELKNIWLHVFRKKIHEGKCNETRWGRDDYDDEQQLNGGNSDAVKKRKDIENKRHDQELADPSASKKARVVWSVELHQKFVDAVNLIGFDNAGPKKILDLMNVPRLTRENVASHLQKYRLYLSRLPQESEIRNSFLGTKQQDFSISDPCGRFGLQNSVAAEQKNVAYGSSEYTQNNIPADMGPEKHEGHWKCMPSIFPVITEFPDRQTASIKSQMGFANCSVFPHQNVQFQPLESSLRAQEWNEVPRMQFKQPPNQKLEPFPMLEADYSYMLLPDPHHIEGYIQHSDPRTIPERDGSTPVKTPLSTQNSSSNSRSETPMRRIITSIPLPADSCVIKPEYFEAIPSVTLSMKSPVVGSNCKSNWQPVGQNLNAVDHSAWPSSLEEKIEFCLPQEYGNAGNLALQNVELLDYSNLEFFTAKHNGDELEFSYDMLRNSIDNSFDQGLFIV